MIKTFEPYFDEDDISYVTDAIRSQYLNENKYTKMLEDEFAKLVNRKYAVVCSNGTASLFMAMRVFGMNATIPNYTAIGTFTGVRLATYQVHLADVNQITGNLLAEEYKGVIVPVDNNGVLPQFNLLREINPGSKFIEDASQGLGSFYDGKPLGSFGDISCFSMATTKIVSMGQGGICVTDDSELYLKLMAMKDQGRIDKGKDEYPCEGYNFKVTEMQSALGYSQLKKLSKRKHRMRQIFKIYEDELGMDNPKEELLWRASIFVPPKRREGIIQRVLKGDVQIQPFFKTISDYLNLNPDKIQASKEYSQRGVYLPSSSTLTDEQVKYVCDVVKRSVKLL